MSTLLLALLHSSIGILLIYTYLCMMLMSALLLTLVDNSIGPSLIHASLCACKSFIFCVWENYTKGRKNNLNYKVGQNKALFVLLENIKLYLLLAMLVSVSSYAGKYHNHYYSLWKRMLNQIIQICRNSIKLQKSLLVYTRLINLLQTHYRPT